jgi:IrrE N-terminal-like domain
MPVDDLSRTDVLAAIDVLVAELLTKTRVFEPPADAVAIAGRLGIPIAKEGRRRISGSERANGDHVVHLKSEASEETRQWFAARAIGQHYKKELIARLDAADDAPRIAGESLANLFAYHLLVPSCWLADDIKAIGYDLQALKERYPTAAHEVIAWRFLDLPEPCIVTIVDNDAVSRRRSSGVRVTKQLSPPERQCQRYVNHYSRPRTVQAQGWTVQGWPVHRTDWKREILRSTVEEEEWQADG